MSKCGLSTSTSTDIYGVTYYRTGVFTFNDFATVANMGNRMYSTSWFEEEREVVIRIKQYSLEEVVWWATGILMAADIYREGEMGFNGIDNSTWPGGVMYNVAPQALFTTAAIICAQYAKTQALFGDNPQSNSYPCNGLVWYAGPTWNDTLVSQAIMEFVGDTKPVDRDIYNGSMVLRTIPLFVCTGTFGISPFMGSTTQNYGDLTPYLQALYPNIPESKFILNNAALSATNLYYLDPRQTYNAFFALANSDNILEMYTESWGSLDAYTFVGPPGADASLRTTLWYTKLVAVSAVLETNDKISVIRDKGRSKELVAPPPEIEWSYLRRAKITDLVNKSPIDSYFLSIDRYRPLPFSTIPLITYTSLFKEGFRLQTEKGNPTDYVQTMIKFILPFVYQQASNGASVVTMMQKEWQAQNLGGGFDFIKNMGKSLLSNIPVVGPILGEIIGGLE